MRAMPSSTDPTIDAHRQTLAAEAWAPLIDFIVATGPQRSRVFGELGLTPNDGRALGSLDPEIGRSMRSLADEWGCDASTATWAIDRLVAKGLAERRDDDRDRRITLVTLTAAGNETARRLRDLVHVPPRGAARAQRGRARRPPRRGEDAIAPRSRLAAPVPPAARPATAPRIAPPR